MKKTLNHLPEPKTRNLDTPHRLTANQNPTFSKVFPLRTKKKTDRFDKQRKANIAAHHHENYKITPKKLKYLTRCVDLLRDQTETSCETKMETFV